MPSKPRLSRDDALAAKPIGVKPLKREPLPDGGERFTVSYKPTGVQKWLLRAPDGIHKSFELDPMGLEVLALCDGQKTVRYIIATFAKRHKVNEHEAEKAVTTFLQTMIRKGLVAVAVG